MPLPNFLCIGAQKAGTSWLFAQLQSHPEVWMPPVKELQFFNHLFVPQNRNSTAWHIQRSVARTLPGMCATTTCRTCRSCATWRIWNSRAFHRTWYEAAFDRPAAHGKFLGDITPEKSTIPEAGLRYLRGYLGAVKIIYLVRAPRERALSQLRMNVSRRDQRPSEAVWTEMAGQWDIANRGDYRTYVPRWKAAFAAGDILFLPYGRIGRDPVGLMRDVEEFLGLSPHDYPRAEERVHRTRKLGVPDAAAARIDEAVAGQAEFLRAEFGADFAEAT